MLNMPKPFRFAVSMLNALPKDEWASKARKIEQLGYSTLVAADHLMKQFAPLTALLAAAEATTTLRVGSYVLNNDFHHPVILAKEAATLDVLSGGRLELGLGAGYMRSEYEQGGIGYDSAPIRIRRLQESIQVLKSLFAEDPANFTGEFYTLANLNGLPKPLQKPSPPLLIGGAGKQLLSLAAREANIVGLVFKARPDGSGLDAADGNPASTTQKIQWIRQAAGARFDTLEINILVFGVLITENHAQALQQVADRLQLTEEQVHENPHYLLGTVDQICNTLQERREQYGISYITVFEQSAELFAPVVARLAGS